MNITEKDILALQEQIDSLKSSIELKQLELDLNKSTLFDIRAAEEQIQYLQSKINAYENYILNPYEYEISKLKTECDQLDVRCTQLIKQKEHEKNIAESEYKHQKEILRHTLIWSLSIFMVIITFAIHLLFPNLLTNISSPVVITLPFWLILCQIILAYCQ